MPTIQENLQNLKTNLAALSAGAKDFDPKTGQWIAPTTTSNPAPNPTTPPRTPGILDELKKQQADTEAMNRQAQQSADAYAAQMRQARIDAINTSFAPRIAREQEAGSARMSRVAALNFKGGITGSGVDTTKTGEQTQLNDKALQAIEQEKAVAINEAFGWADQLGKERATLLTKQAQEGAEAKVKYAQDKVDTALKALDTFAGLGKITSAKDLMAADQNTYETLKDVSGMSDSEIDAYLKTKAPQGTYQWSQAQISGNTMYVPTIKNGVASMEKISLGFTPNKEAKSVTKTDDGVFILYNDGTYKNIITGGGSGGKPINILDAQRYNELYPEAGVVPGDTQSEADAKVSKLNTPESKLRNLVVAAKDNGNSYDVVVKEIDSDPSVTDKATAKKIAGEVYGVSTPTTSQSSVSGPVYGTGNFKNVEINNRAQELKKVLGNGTAVRAQLIKDGYSKQAATTAANSVSGVLDSVTNVMSQYLFGE